VIQFWCDFKFAPQVREIVGHFDDTIAVKRIVSGKLRRYYHLSLWQHVTWPSLMFKNIGDGFLVIIGAIQSLVKLIIWRPDVVFTKGGYVCLPVGWAAHVLRIPLVIHDSDAHPGLTNRILSRWATKIATGAPLEYYSYPADRSRYVGIPVSSEFKPFTGDEKIAARMLWRINQTKPLVVVTGGGLGAQRINLAVAETLPALLKHASVVLIAGTGQYDELRSLTPPNSEDFQLHAFISKDIAQLFGAADIVVARAGATTILELAALEKPTILIPNGKLTGGHQLKNAAVYAEKDAVVVINEDDLGSDATLLTRAITDLLAAPASTNAMAKRFAHFSKPQAAKDMAEMILSVTK
jgi:UDP-N-acetylglucosamine--N-acetylmuramyl-(pentapeptide) pyrophosphoryl-undecaprenol N-acetylglucosamine transferase